MNVLPENASELKNIAQEIGGDVLEGDLRYPSETGGWQLGGTNLTEYLSRYRDQRVMFVIAPLGEAEGEKYVCGICGFVMDELQECPRCKLMTETAARDIELLNDVREFLGDDADE